MTAQLYAKSPNNAADEPVRILTLAAHTAHVVAAAERFALAWDFDPALARAGAVLHDLGKGHPATQAMLLRTLKLKDVGIFRSLLAGAPWQHAVEREARFIGSTLSTPHRHELSSLGFLPLFPAEIWPALVEMVVAHHKSVWRDASGRGFLDLAAPESLPNVAPVRERHLEGWELWSGAAIAIAAEFGVEARRIDVAEAAAAFDAAFEIVQARPKRWSRWRGLLMSADHFGSAYDERTAERAGALFSPPDAARVYGPDGRYSPSDAYPLSLRYADAADPRRHTLVVAPTGSGKTNFLFRRCRARVFYTLPFQASINAMAERVRGDLGRGADVRRLHAASGIGGPDDSDGQEDVRLQRLPGAAVKVLTPHQLAAIVFGTAGHEALALDLRGQDVILDEIHTYGPLALSMVERLIRVAAMLDCRVHVGTATIPAALREIVVAALGGAAQLCEVRLHEEELDGYDRHTVEKVEDEDAALARVAQAVEAGERVLVVSNRVARAQDRFSWVAERFPHVTRLLLHSRYRRMDRARLERRVHELGAGREPCVVSATQVVEVSLDVSFDTLVTDAAPLDALVQRFGRVNRHARAGDPLRPVVVIAPPTRERDALPYEADTVRRSYDALPEGPLRERSIQARIDAVYPKIAPLSIALDFAHDENLVERLHALDHQPRSLIVEVLQIESETAIRQSDEAAYRQGTAKQRVPLEIPAPEILGRLAHQNRWKRVQHGAWPVVVPDEQYDAVLGLMPLREVEPADPAESFHARAI